MPASAELTVKIRDDVVAEVCAKAGCAPPRWRIHMRSESAGKNMVALGNYDVNTKTINLYVHSDRKALNEANRLRFVQRALNETALHELRHHVQFQTWSPEKLARAQEGPYAQQGIEKDANEWADAYKETINVVRVKRTFGSSRFSGFGKLSAAQEGARC